MVLASTRMTEAIERSDALDQLGDKVRRVVEPLVGAGRRRDVLTGRWLGHAAHPMLVAAPIGLWIAGVAADALGGAGSARTARRLIGLGALTAIPAAATGAADWIDTRGAEQRVGSAHAMLNNAALATFVGSWFARGRGDERLGRWLSRLGLVGVAAAGYLGGHLAYVRGVGVNTTAFQSGPDEWTQLCPLDSLTTLADGEVSRRSLGSLGFAVVRRQRTGDDAFEVLEDRCTHRGGPLSDGNVDGDCIVCPWHGSSFSTTDGAVRSGPASVAQPVYETRRRDGHLEIRRGELGGLRTSPAGARREAVAE